MTPFCRANHDILSIYVTGLFDLATEFDMNILFEGLILGFAYVAPIGLQNLFVINSALTQTRSRSYMTAFIVIFFDISLALICFYGIGLLLERWDILRMIILLIGGSVVIYMGISLIRAKAPEDMKKNMDMPITKLIASACVVTWFNPQAIIDGSMLLGASRAALPDGTDTIFIIGVCGASALWFLSITTILMFFKKLFKPGLLRWINIICGIIIVVYGAKLIYNFITMIIELYG